MELNLEPQVNQYERICSARAVAEQDSMWQCVLHLQKILDVDDNGNELYPFRAAKMVQNMQDNFDALEWRRSISRPNFIACVLKALEGIGQNCADKRRTRGIIPRLHSVYSSFDTLGRDALDWRTFLFYLRFARSPHVGVQCHLSSHFCEIGGTKKSMDGMFAADIIPLCQGKLLGGNAVYIWRSVGSGCI